MKPEKSKRNKSLSVAMTIGVLLLSFGVTWTTYWETHEDIRIDNNGVPHSMDDGAVILGVISFIAGCVICGIIVVWILTHNPWNVG